MYDPRMKMRPALFILPVMLLLAACLGTQQPAPVSNFGQSPGAGSAGVHNALSGETVYGLSKRYNISVQDIIIVNELRAPFRLKEGQRVTLPPPQEYRVRDGDSLYTVSRLFNVNSSELAKLNRMQPPYTLRTGQVLRLPSLSRKAQKTPVMARMAPAYSPPPQVPAPIRGEALAPPPSAVSSAAIAPVPPPDPRATEKPPATANKAVLTTPPPRSGTVFMRPVSGQIVSAFGPKKSGLHNDGINIGAARGTPVRAAENGVVVYAGNELKGSGNLVLLRHQGQWMTAYGHMDKMMVKRGQTVKRGETIGTVGSTGSVASPQLHFEVRRGTEALNPVNYIEK